MQLILLVVTLFLLSANANRHREEYDYESEEFHRSSSIASVSDYSQTHHTVCRHNERYLSCGTACPLTCKNYDDPPKLCSQQCVKGCFCKENLVRAADGSCVRPSQCHPPVCRHDEQYLSCGTACPLTCENYDDPPEFCTEQCVKGCFCKENLVRAADGSCVRPSQCHRCRHDEEYLRCGTACPLTCKNYHNPPKFCTEECVEGCFCKDNRVRTADGSCVHPSQCRHY